MEAFLRKSKVRKHSRAITEIHGDDKIVKILAKKAVPS
jgi:hypothetical protein